MKRLLVILAVLALVPAAAQATPINFTLNSYTVTTDTTEPGVMLTTADLLGEPFSFSLENVAGTYITRALFQATNREGWESNDSTSNTLSVAFNFTAPPPAPFGGTDSGAAIGHADYFLWVIPYNEQVKVTWADPIYLNFGTTGKLKVDLSDVTFDFSDWGTVQATFTLDKIDVPVPDPPAPTAPEPASMLLLGTGLIGLAAKARRRLRK